MKKYLARHGRVWRKIGTNEVLGSEIELKKDERIAQYEQIPYVEEKTQKAEKAEQTGRAGKKPVGVSQREGI